MATASEQRGTSDRFRPDIEGLRAVAIVAVLLCHAGLASFAGGYVGVDVFFVISGFLITGLLRREVAANGTVRLGRFYGARARRLLLSGTRIRRVRAMARRDHDAVAVRAPEVDRAEHVAALRRRFRLHLL
jgi:hypothetical protein